MRAFNFNHESVLIHTQVGHKDPLVVFIASPPIYAVSEDLDCPQFLVRSYVNGEDVSALAITIAKVFDSIVDNRADSSIISHVTNRYVKIPDFDILTTLGEDKFTKYVETGHFDHQMVYSRRHGWKGEPPSLPMLVLAVALASPKTVRLTTPFPIGAPVGSFARPYMETLLVLASAAV